MVGEDDEDANSGEDSKGASAKQPGTPTRSSTPLKHSSSTSHLLSASGKRQRLDRSEAAMTTLIKPFRSPLLNRQGDASSKQAIRSTPPDTPSKRTASSLMKPPKTQRFEISRTSRIQSSNSIASDPEITALNSQLTTLRTRLKAAQTYLSMSQQALALESLPSTHKDSDEHLGELISKWRGAARQAADYLFGVAGDRVNRMGGAKAYFERERDRRTKWGGDEAADNVYGGRDNTDENGEEIDQELIEERKRQLMVEYDLDRSQHTVNIPQTDEDVSLFLSSLAFPDSRGWSREAGVGKKGGRKVGRKMGNNMVTTINTITADIIKYAAFHYGHDA